MKQPNSQADIIKTELFRKIHEHEGIENKICDIESKTELSWDQLIDTHEQYGELCFKKLDLESEIENLLIEAVYVPLIGLSNSEKQKIDFFTISHSLDYDEILEKYFDKELPNFIDDRKARFKKLKGLYLTREVDPRIVMLYKEIARCYVYCLFAASTTLCRALVESVAEEYCRQSEEFDKKIKAARNFEKRKIIYDFLKSKLPQEMLDIYSEIGKAGSFILHQHCDKPNEEEVFKPDEKAFKIIELSQKFINKIYKTPDFSSQAELV